MARDLAGGGADYLSRANGEAATNLTTAWSVAGWVYIDTLPGALEWGIFSHDYDAGTRLVLPVALAFGNPPSGGNNKMFVGFYKGATWYTQTDPTAYTTGVWIHAAGTWDNATLRIFRNGSSVASGSPGITPDAVPANTTIYSGSTWYRPNNVSENGKIAEVGVWNVALSLEEVAALAKGVSPNMIRRGALKHYTPIWGTASPEVELSGNGNNMTLTGTGPVSTHCPVGPLIPFAV